MGKKKLDKKTSRSYCSRGGGSLEMGIFEMLHSKDVPPVVAMDEAIELAKTFGSENSAKFINGVLNAILEAKK